MLPDDFDLAAWVTDETPALLEAEAAEEWGRARARTPVTELLAEGGLVAAFLASPGEPPEGLGRSERREYLDQRDAAEAEAREAAMDAAREHAHLTRMLRYRAAGDARDAFFARAGKAAKEAEEGPRAPTVKGPDQPTDVGRW